MRIKLAHKTMALTVMVLMIGAGVAFAHGGWGGYGRDRGPGMGYQGRHMMDFQGRGAYGPGMQGNGRLGALTEEEQAKLEPLREKFLQETESLRLKINEKQFALRQELIKSNPDSAKAAQLQKELSTVRSEFDQKTLEHRLEVRTVLPEKSFGPGRGYGPKFGRGGGGYCR